MDRRDEQLQAARKALQAGDHAGALAIAEELLAADPGDGDALYVAAVAARVAPKSSLGRPARSGVSWRDKAGLDASAPQRAPWYSLSFCFSVLSLKVFKHNANYARFEHFRTMGGV